MNQTMNTTAMPNNSNSNITTETTKAMNTDSKKKPLSTWAQIFVDIKVPESVCDTKHEPLSIDVEPTDCDVLLGRDRASSNSKGNKQFREMIRSRIEEYEALSTRSAKIQFVSSMVTAVHKMNGRFLRQEEESGMWFEVSNDTARDKAGHTIRDAVSARRRAKNRATKRNPCVAKIGSNKTIKSKAKTTVESRKQTKPRARPAATVSSHSESIEANKVTSGDDLMLDRASFDIMDVMIDQDLEPISAKISCEMDTVCDVIFNEGQTLGMLPLLDDPILDGPIETLSL